MTQNSIFTLAELNEQITAYKKALKALAINKEYSAEGVTYTRSDIKDIRDTLEWLNEERSKIVNQHTGPVKNRGIVRR